MRAGAPFGWVMALALGIVLMLSREAECQGLHLGHVKHGLRGLGLGRGDHGPQARFPEQYPPPPPSGPPFSPSPPPHIPPSQPSTPPPVRSPLPPPAPQFPPPQASPPPPFLRPPPPPLSAPRPPPPPPPPIPSGLRVGFYKGRCPNSVDVEALIATLVQQEFSKNPNILALLLRMQFHDCFVHGCDASILIDGPSSEKRAGPNFSVGGYEFIDAVKAAVELQCPGVVSCADIIAITTKQALKLGGGPDYPGQTGRRDGRISRAEDVDLPSPFQSVTECISAFAAKNFSAEELVVLLGGHTVGITHCPFFQDRLYQGTSQFDRQMDPALRRELTATCPKGTSTTNSTALDQGPNSANKFDNSFYAQILNQRGILPIDQNLARDSRTSGFVQLLANNATLFKVKLAAVMVKLQAVEVLTGTQGEIRKVCRKFN